MSLSGKLIVIEGLEGAGKSTAVTTVIDRLHQFNIDVQAAREPGGTAIGEILRSILKNTQFKETLNSRTELLLLYAARTQLLTEVIKPALKKGIWVVADRFELSSFAYQGGGRGLDLSFIEKLSHFCLEGLTPDLSLFLNISPETGMERAKKRGQFDRIEQESIDFFHRIHRAYLNRINHDPAIKIVDAAAPLEAVQQKIIHILDDYLSTCKQV